MSKVYDNAEKFLIRSLLSGRDENIAVERLAESFDVNGSTVDLTYVRPNTIELAVYRLRMVRLTSVDMTWALFTDARGMPESFHSNA